MSQLRQSNYPKYVVLPFFFDVEVKQLEGNLPALNEYMDYFRDEELMGIGLPPVLTGKGGSSEGANIQLEILVRQTKYLQNVIGNEFRRQLFPEVLLGDPTRSQRIVTRPAKRYPYIKPSVFSLVPEIRWNTIESVADMRLRHDVYAKHGLLSQQEIRKEIGLDGKVARGDLPPTVALAFKQLDQVMKQQKMQLEAQMMQKEMQMEEKDKAKKDDVKEEKTREDEE